MGKLLRFPRRRAKRDAGTKPLFPGLIPGATDARPAYFASDASAAPIGTRAATDEDLLRKLKRRRRASVAALGAVCLAGSLAAVFGERGLLDNRRQRAELAKQILEVEAHQKVVQGIKRDVERLQTDPRAIERIAREDLGYAENGEILVLLPDDLDSTSRSAIVPTVSPVPTP